MAPGHGNGTVTYTIWKEGVSHMEEERKSCVAKTLLATGGNCVLNMFVSMLLHLWTMKDFAVHASPAGEIHSCKLMIYTVYSKYIPLAAACVRYRLVHMGCASQEITQSW